MSLSSVLDDIGGAAQRWLTGPAPGNLVRNMTDDALRAGRAILRGATMPARGGPAATNLWTGLVVKPWVSYATFGAGMALGLGRGIMSLDEMKATGTVYPAVQPPNLTYDYSINAGRTTPYSAESLGAGGDLVFALNDAYMR